MQDEHEARPESDESRRFGVMFGGIHHRFIRDSTRRALLMMAADFDVWAVAFIFAVGERYDFRLTHIPIARTAEAIPGAALLAVVCGTLVGLYAGNWSVGSLDEAPALTVAATLATVVVFAADSVWWHNPLPRSSVLGAGFIALVLMAGGRLGLRLYRERGLRPRPSASRMIVFGAGEGGMQSVRAMQRHPESPYLPVAFLDDNPDKRNLRYLGVRVRGGRDEIARVARDVRAESLLIAIPSADRETIAPVTSAAEAAGLEVKVLPKLTEFVGVNVDVADIRDVSEEDLLGRRQIETDVASIADYLAGHRVLVTGAGGSIGSELCRQISRFGPSALIKLDHDGSALHQLELSLTGRALLDGDDVVVTDIRDLEGIKEVFLRWRPDVVFHAAALKHLPILETHPGEAVKTNVWGTVNVLDAAAAAGVGRFVNISTDKAADPISVLGYSKRITERLTAAYARTHPGVWVSVRFGNVLGSRGSMLPTFRSQTAAGGPVTVTHPDATRFFMTIAEAVELVVQAGAIGRSGEALVLDMGEPVRIDDVARRVVNGAPRPVEIVYTGLRPGEKVHEALTGAGEEDIRPFHPLISHVSVPPLEATVARGLPTSGDGARIVAQLRQLACREGLTASSDR